ncbi:MAG: N-formylglutamate amidohydrolase [Alphaproteobacteria bacterium]|nr:N-formylglutamate amidohydrolase [Alphaproteobacteria bacterium]
MNAPNTLDCPDSLAGDDPETVLILNPTSTREILIIADHAGNAVPFAMKGLGLKAGELDRHIAWDPGAALVATELANRLEATAVLSQYTRLIVDPNRPLGDISSMPTVSDGTQIPGNHDLSETERADRAALFYWPYHMAISLEMARLRRAGPGPMLVSIHSFTPEFGDEERPWHIGVMAAADRRLGDAVIAGLSENADITIGDNQPYSGVEYGYTLKVHAGSQGLANVQIEIRQDLLTDDNGILRWAGLLEAVLKPLLDESELQAIAYH